MHSKQLYETSSAVAHRQSFWRWLLNDYIKKLVVHCNLCIEVKRERAVLAKLSDEELRDIGIHRADADAESRRHFHDLPADRLGLYEDPDVGSCGVQERREM